MGEKRGYENGRNRHKPFQYTDARNKYPEIAWNRSEFGADICGNTQIYNGDKMVSPKEMPDTVAGQQFYHRAVQLGIFLNGNPSVWDRFSCQCTEARC